MTADSDFPTLGARTLQIGARAAERLTGWLDCACECARDGDLKDGAWAEPARAELADGRLTASPGLLDWIRQWGEDAKQTYEEWAADDDPMPPAYQAIEARATEIEKHQADAVIAELLLAAFGAEGVAA